MSEDGRRIGILDIGVTNSHGVIAARLSGPFPGAKHKTLNRLEDGTRHIVEMGS